MVAAEEELVKRSERNSHEQSLEQISEKKKLLELGSKL